MRLSPENRTALCLRFVTFKGCKEEKRLVRDSLPARLHSHTREGGGGDAESHNSHKLWRPNEVGGPLGEWLINVGQTPGGKATDRGRVTTVGLCCL